MNRTDHGSIARYRMTLPLAVLLLCLLAGYFYIFMNYPKMTRYFLVAGITLTVAFLVKPSPSSWLPVLPLVFAAGGMTFPVAQFQPAMATMAMFGFGFFFLADRLIYNKPLFYPSRYLYILSFALFLQIVSIVISAHVHRQYFWNSVRDGSSLFLYFPLAMILPVLCRTRSRLETLHKALVVTTLVVSLIGVAQYFSITSFSSFSRIDANIGYVYRGRISSLFGNANVFAGYLEMAIPMAIALLFLTKSMKWRIISLLTVVLSFMSVLYTFSRGGLIFAFMGFTAIMLYIFRKRLWIPVAVGIGMVAFLISNADTFERQMSFILNPREQMHQPTILHRYVAYNGYLDQIEESPLTGVGYGARSYFWGRSRLYSFWEGRFTRSTETIRRFGGLNSLFLNNAVKGGLISLSAAVILFAGIFYAFCSSMKKGGGVLAFAIAAGLFSFMGHQVVGNQIRFPTVNSLFWFNTGLLLTILAIKERDGSTTAVWEEYE